MKTTDLLVIGGGINGAGIAADAAGRGIRVTLCEMGDLASGTSSNSSKLIHGGLRYLESYEFSLVKESLIERQLLLKNAPHLMKPLEFIIPHCKKLRSFWLLRLGMFLYDKLNIHHILPKSRTISFEELQKYKLKSEFTKALGYYDCQIDDARLVVMVAQLANHHGAEILTHHKIIAISAEKDYWLVKVQDQNSRTFSIAAKNIINASGPWVNLINTKVPKIEINYRTKFVKGSHLIIKKQFDNDKAFVLQADDRRIVFVLPYMNNYHLLGTTDIEVKTINEGDCILDEERDYLLGLFNTYFTKQISRDDIVHEFWGIRPLIEEDNKNASQTSREYKLDYQSVDNLAYITVYGGKITTYRKLSEEVVNLLKRNIPNLQKPWTHKYSLPGGDIISYQCMDISNFAQKIRLEYRELNVELLRRLIRSYGTNIYKILKNVKNEKDLGINFSNSLYQKEVDYLIEAEWVTCAQDLLERRSKLGLQFTTAQAEELNQYIMEKINKKI